MKLDTSAAYFHDGRIIDIKHHEDNLDIWMESSELEAQWPTNFLLSKDNTIKGVLHFKGVENIKINDKEISKKLEFSFDYGEILDLEIENNQICSLNVIWKVFDPTKRLRQYESIKIKAKEINWENLPNLEAP